MPRGDRTLDGEILRGIVADMDDGIIAVDMRGTILYCNRSVEEMFGYAAEALIGRSLDCLLPERFRGGHVGRLGQFAAGAAKAAYMGSRTAHIVGQRADGSEVRLGATILRIESAAGTTLVSVLRDISERLEHQAQLERLASTDPLTGMLNRRAFHDIAARELSRGRARGHPTSLLLFDIDHFKSINDRFGHDAGDRVICRFTEVMRAVLRGSDVAARWGGEEFIVLMPQTDLERAVLTAEIVRRNTQALSFADEIGDGLLLTVSAGLVSSPQSAEHLSELIKQADQALYAAKSAGRNRVTAMKPAWTLPAHFTFAAIAG